MKPITFLQLKEILSLVSIGKIINQAKIQKDGKVLCMDESGTMISALKYNDIDMPWELNITNIDGVKEAMSKFLNTAIVDVINGKLHISQDSKYIDIVLSDVKSASIPMINGVELVYSIVCKSVSHEHLKNLGKLRPPTLIEGNYFLNTHDNKLFLSIGVESSDENSAGDVIGNIDSNIVESTYFTMNISEVFSSINNSVDLCIAPNQALKIISKTDNYYIEYYLAARVK